MRRMRALGLVVALAACSAAEELAVDEAELAGACGEGTVVYLDWVCGPDGWRLERVGEREWRCDAAQPEPLVGREAACRVSTLRACAETEHAECDVTRGCATAPPIGGLRFASPPVGQSPPGPPEPCGFHD
jgi:hypothetical protein